MDLQLRCISSHPRASNATTTIEFEFSSRFPRLVTAAGDLLVDQSTSTNATLSSIRTSSRVEKVVYVGGSTAFLVFMENGHVVSYVEHLNSLRHVHEMRISGDGRSVTLGEGSRFGQFALFCKADSPSLWCILLNKSGVMADPFKLRSDIEGDQESINFVGGVFAKVRDKVATKPKSRVCPIVAIATHPSMSLVSAAYKNGIIRVWDIVRKEQRSHFDAQLLLRENIVDIAMHPTSPIVLACTSHGRIMSFYIKTVPFKRGDDPHLATSKTRDRKRRFRAMCFMPGSPAYLLLLTASRRVLVRMVDKGGLIVGSSRFPKASRPLAVGSTSLLTSARTAGFEDAEEFSQDGARCIKMSCEPAFGLIATSLDSTGDVFVFQVKADGLPGIRRPISSGVDTELSHEQGNALRGPITVPADSVIAYKGFLFSYRLGVEEATKLCQLPSGDVSRIEVSRDEDGYCQAVLVFFLGDDEVHQTHDYAENEEPARYTLCTRRGDDETWTVSEPAEGRSGCFLNVPGKHDRIMILASSGTMISLLSFAGAPGKDGISQTRQGRGVRRIKFDGKSAAAVFRSPFANWSAVVYHDLHGRRLCVSRNAFAVNSSSGGYQAANYTEEDFGMDEDTAFPLQDKETVIDVRWQRLPPDHGRELYLGAVMTNTRIIFVRDVFRLVSVFEFCTVEKIVVPFAPPSFSWVGPSVMVLFGNSLISVSADGRSDLIAGVSHGENVTALVAALPDRVVFARPSPKNAMNSLSIASRPYSAMSGLVRGMFALPKLGGPNESRRVEEVRAILESHDVSQGSSELTKALLQNDLAAIAYLLAVSEQGKFSMSPLRRAAFLGRIGDIRGALKIAEGEYALLQSHESFHHGTDLYRLLQRILNIALASGDFNSARRCSQLLGRRGTFSSFVDVEGGFAAITSVVNHCKAQGNHGLVSTLRPVIERSSKSSVATDSSLMPSQSGLETIRRAIQSVNMASIPLGQVDVPRTFLKAALGKDGSGNVTPGFPMELKGALAQDINDRLEMWKRDVGFDLLSQAQSQYDDSFTYAGNSEVGGDDSEGVGNKGGVVDKLGHTADSSDEEDLFNTGGNEGTDTVKTNSSGVVEREAAQLRERIRQQELESSGMLADVKVQTRTLVQAQGATEKTGEVVAAVRARDMLERGIANLDEGRLTSAQNHLDTALRVIQRGYAKGQMAPVELLREVVYYRLLVQVKRAMGEIVSSEHANTLAGRVTYMQLVSGLMLVALRDKHRVEVLVEAADAYMMMNNFGSAAQSMHEIKKVGVGDELRRVLRDKYAVCSARGFTDAMPQGAVRLCFDTLRVIGVGARALSCTVCPAQFVSDGRVGVGQVCLCCGIGSVKIV